MAPSLDASGFSSHSARLTVHGTPTVYPDIASDGDFLRGSTIHVALPAVDREADDPSVHPVNGGVEVGAVETEASTTYVPPDTTPKLKKRTRDAADVMEEVMDKAVKAVREASS
ncbi:hypothetical protein PF011_g8688 [Phytophthora fragariae]|uniref:Uncharacterized protein n=1 Tax=Phytophthora fragariae TaxID=53985 RepID=A0A6A3L4G9_9STRA|nr:hypothetical protein PF011_g8688 [Phytophthora fragariae]